MDIRPVTLASAVPFAPKVFPAAGYRVRDVDWIRVSRSHVAGNVGIFEGRALRHFASSGSESSSRPRISQVGRILVIATIEPYVVGDAGSDRTDCDDGAGRRRGSLCGDQLLVSYRHR